MHNLPFIELVIMPRKSTDTLARDHCGTINTSMEAELHKTAWKMPR